MKDPDAPFPVRLRWAVPGTVERCLRGCFTVDDVRAVAHRRWPVGIRGYVEGGADAEVSLRRNRQAYEEYALMPFALRDVSGAETGTSLLGQRVSVPLALGPTGYSRMMHSAGEPAVARAAQAAGVPYTLATLATTSIEDLASEVPGDWWFQLYVLRDRGLTREMVDRARSSGYRALVLTVDTPVPGLRVPKRRGGGTTMPPRLRSLGSLLDMARHPLWGARMLASRASVYANLRGPAGSARSGAVSFAFDDTLGWEDLAQIRQMWSGPLVIKGLLRAEDAVLAADAGADAVVLSNHGGRQLDQSLAPLHVVPEVVDALRGRVEVLVDSGIRRGSDIAIALALGADGVLIGRPYLYGLGAGGQQGVARVIEILRTELLRTMQLLGVRSVDELRREGPNLVRPIDPPPRPAPVPAQRSLARTSDPPGGGPVGGSGVASASCGTPRSTASN